LSGIFDVDLELSHQLLEVLHLFFVVVIVVVELVISFAQLLPVVLGSLEVSLHLFNHLGFINLAFLRLFLHEFLVIDEILMVLVLRFRAFLQKLLLLVTAIVSEDTHLSAVLVFQLLNFALVKIDVKLLLLVQTVSLLVKLSNPDQFVLLQRERLVGE
jgi:hypothetical protein